MRYFLKSLKKLLSQIAKFVAGRFRRVLSLFLETPKPANNTFGISPRLAGIIEQFERAKLFYNESIRSTEKLDRFRRFIATIYFGRAVVELMLEAAEKQEVNMTRGDLEKILICKLPRYLLIEKLRIHDFHRFGLLLRQGFFGGGPFKLILKASKDRVTLQETSQGPMITKTGKSEIKEQRVLRMKGDKVFDEEQGEYVSLQEVLSDYLDAIPQAIEEFRKLQAKKLAE